MNSFRIGIFLPMVVFSTMISAQVLPQQGCAVKYSYDNAGNRTDRYWHCWTDVAEAVKSVLQVTSLKAFPNPSDGLLTIEIEGALEEGVLDLLTPDGKIQRTLNNPAVSSQWDLSGLANGIYWVRYTSKGEMLFSTISLSR